MGNTTQYPLNPSVINIIIVTKITVESTDIQYNCSIIGSTTEYIFNPYLTPHWPRAAHHYTHPLPATVANPRVVCSLGSKETRIQSHNKVNRFGHVECDVLVIFKQDFAEKRRRCGCTVHNI